MSANPRALTIMVTSILTPGYVRVTIAASLSGLAPKQGITGAGAVKQHGEVPKNGQDSGSFDSARCARNKKPTCGAKPRSIDAQSSGLSH